MSAQKPLLLLLATVHLDSQWRWTIRDTISEFLPRTLAENFALFRSRPSYVLNFEGAFRYMLVREYYPEAWKELRDWCEAGRWMPAGGMLDAPDVNIVSPESLIRHILYGNDFFERELGVRSRDVFLPDCFGFGHALPSIAVHCGLECFSTSKLLKWKAPGEIPFDIGRWRGPDGAEILAVLTPGGYGEGIERDLSRSERWLGRLEAMRERCGRPVGVRYFGTGDRGGSPDRATLDRVEESVASDGPIEVRCAASHAIRDELDDEAVSRLPVHDSEILLPTHGTGCWTSQAALKRWNRKNELLAAAAERASVVADWSGAADYPRERIDEAWLRLLWHQMHDDLTGTSIPDAYEITWNDEAVAANLFAGVLVDAVSGLAARLDSRPPAGLAAAQPLVVFNPTGLAREDVVELVLDRGALPASGPPLVWRRGAPLPTQVEPFGEDRVRLLFAASVRPLSFTVFHLAPGAPPPDDGGLRATEGLLENHRYRVEIVDGEVSAIHDRRLGRELLSAPLRLELLRDRSNRWPAWEILPATLLEGRTEVVAGPARACLVESGPVRVAVEVERSFRGSTLVQTIRLARDGGGDRLEIANRLDWATRGRLLKAAFPFAASGPRADYDLGLGVIERDNNSADRYEVPAQQWAAITDRGGEFGAAVLNDCLYGWDKPADDTLRLSLVRSPSSRRKYPHQRRQDHGTHRSLLAVVGHAGEADRAQLARQAERLNQPLIAFRVEPGEGDLGDELALFDRIDGEVSVMALKRAERRPGYVLRLRSLVGRAQTVRLDSRVPILRASRLRGDERSRGEIGTAPTAELGPWGLETLGLELAPAASAGRARSAHPVALPFDRRATSLHDRTDEPDFDGRGASIPGELFPGRLIVGGAELRLGPTDGPNAMRCAGQVLELLEDQDGLWLVAASSGEPTLLDLELDTGRRRLVVAPWTGWLASRPRPARWRGLGVASPPRTTTEEVAWLGAHRHRRRGPSGAIEDEPYVFCYLFRYHLELPAGTRRLRFPDAPHAHVFALTSTRGFPPRAAPLQPLYGD
jgi:alpha-mannosidase